jgi:hypothetical protein
VLIVGGYSGSGDGALASAELYDPTTGTFSATGSLKNARSLHTATLLKDGRVLIAGGHNDTTAPAPAELYDPKTGTFTTTGSLANTRWGHTATLLSDGRVLIAGGNIRVGTSSFTATASAEIYDPATAKFTAAADMKNALAWHSATLLSNGRVLLAGGQFGSTDATYAPAAQVFDPTTGKFTATGPLNQPRAGQAAAILPNGQVLLVGGYEQAINFDSTELFDPTAGTFSSSGTMSTVRYYPTASVLTDGRILVAGGYDDSDTTASAELYDPKTGEFTDAGSMTDSRARHTATVLTDGRILLVGGRTDSDSVASAELYQP